MYIPYLKVVDMNDYLTQEEIDELVDSGEVPEQLPTGFSSWKMRNYYWWKITSELTESEYEGRKVTLNKPFRMSDGKSKFGVYVKNSAGKVVRVRFGDPNMEIKRDDPERRKSFRARHNCADKKDKTSAGYWSCKQWRANTPVQDSVEINPEEKAIMEKETLEEAISRQERIKRGMRMKRRANFLHRRAEIASRRMPSQQKLMSRARRLAARMLKMRLSRKSPEDMSPAEKTRIEDRVRKMGPIVERMARKLMPKLKQHASQRMRSATSGEAKQQAESVEQKSFIEDLSQLSEMDMKAKIQSKMTDAFKKKSTEVLEADPCWKDYEMVGMKEKNGKKVPNCVPKNESLDEVASYHDMRKMGTGPKKVKSVDYRFNVEYTHKDTGEKVSKTHKVTLTGTDPSYMDAGRRLVQKLKADGHKVHSVKMAQDKKDGK